MLGYLLTNVSPEFFEALHRPRRKYVLKAASGDAELRFEHRTVFHDVEQPER